MTRGFFITIEGGEGAGKSTQMALLGNALAEREIPTTLTREPGGTPAGEAIRALLLGTDVQLAPETEALLHNAARRQHLADVVAPALAAGRVVLCDRFSLSTIAYQGYGHGVPLAWLRTLEALTLGEVRPDLTFVLDVDEKTVAERLAARGGAGDRYEGMGADFHRRVREGFRLLATESPERRLVDARGPAETVLNALVGAVATALGVAA